MAMAQQIPQNKIIPQGLIDGHAYCYPRALQQRQHIGNNVSHDELFQDYIKTLRKNNIHGALLAQPSALGLNHHYLLDCLDYVHQKYPDMFFRGIVNLPPNIHINTMKQMNTHGIIGVRMNLIDRFAPDFHSPSWHDFIAHIHQMGWFLGLQVEGERLPDLLPTLLDEVPYLVLEHFCLPKAQLGSRDDGILCLNKLSRSQKQKLSIMFAGPYHVFDNLSGDQAAQQIVPVAHAIIDAMGGEEYCIWGSDWPFGKLTHKQDYTHALEWGSMWLQEDGRKGMLHLLNKIYYHF